MTVAIDILKDRPLPITDHVGLRGALDAANTATLLMVYVHYTHDEAMLERFAPHIRTPYSFEPPSLPAELDQSLKDALFDLLTRTPPPTLPALPPALMQKMMSVGVREEVADEFMPLLLEQMGFEPPLPRTERPGRTPPPPGFKVVVIGAGLAGIAAAVKLGEAGYDHVVIEKNADVGGAWYENRYPGVGVDTPSHFYSYSFAITPEWGNYHPRGQDMYAYFRGVADKHGVAARTMFNTRAIACVYDEARALWRVTVQTQGEPEQVIEANAVFNAQGIVNRPRRPDIEGLDSFAGVAMHSATWDPSVDLAGKKVVMIGTGASGHQLAPAIAPIVEHLTICQRSRHWVMRNPEAGAAVPEGVKYALRHIPMYREWFRFNVYWFASDGLFVNVVRDMAWPQEHSVSQANEMMRQFALHHMRTSLEGRPDLIEKVMPDHPIFSKRILMDSKWFATLVRDNVAFEAQPVRHIEPDAVVMQDGTRHRADVLALATGFHIHKMLGSLEVIGREGRSLGEEWGEEEARSYMGITIPGYPNFFFSVGPNSAPNHAAGQNIVSEAQVNYMIECLDAVVAAGKRAIEPRQDAFQAWNDMVDARMEQMIWSHPKADSYYNNSKRRVYLSWPYRLVEYWQAMRGPDVKAYELT